MNDSDISPPPAKKRKLNSIFKKSFASNSHVFEHLEDITFVVGNEACGIERINGNRTIFSVHSQVLRAQLFGKMKEASSNEILIDDITPQAFKFLKKLFYVNDEKLNIDIVLDVLFASKKYLLIDLESECYKFIENISKLKDWWKLIIQQKITTDIDMEDALIRKSQVLIQNSEKIGQNDDKLSQLTPQWMAKLVQSSSFVIGKEETVWQICLKYCQNKVKCKTKVSLSQQLEQSEQSELKECECNNVNEMMHKYFIKHIRFPIMDKEYFFNHIESSGILDGETKYQICKVSFVPSVEGQKHYKYDNSSPYCWYPRKPYYQFFFARYDIKLLKIGDVVGFRSQCGSYLDYEIESMDWVSPTLKNRFGSKGIKFAKYGILKCKNISVDDINYDSPSCFMSVDGLSLSLMNRNCHLVQPQAKDIAIYQVGMKVEWKKVKNSDWIKGKITTIDRHSKNPTTMIVVDDTKHFHPWDFDRLRPL